MHDKDLKLDAIITDVILPDGLELIKSIRNTYPHIRILFIAGYVDIPLIELIKQDYKILEKPFDIENLVEHINKVN